MLKIVRVGTLDDDTVDIELNNGSLILLEMSKLLDSSPVFSGLRDNHRFHKLNTDGNAIHWDGGVKLSLEEVFALLKEGISL